MFLCCIVYTHKCKHKMPEVIILEQVAIDDQTAQFAIMKGGENALNAEDEAKMMSGVENIARCLRGIFRDTLGGDPNDHIVLFAMFGNQFKCVLVGPRDLNMPYNELYRTLTKMIDTPRPLEDKVYIIDFHVVVETGKRATKLIEKPAEETIRPFRVPA